MTIDPTDALVQAEIQKQAQEKSTDYTAGAELAEPLAQIGLQASNPETFDYSELAGSVAESIGNATVGVGEAVAGGIDTVGEIAGGVFEFIGDILGGL